MSHVEFKKLPCRRVDFSGPDPLLCQYLYYDKLLRHGLPQKRLHVFIPVQVFRYISTDLMSAYRSILLGGGGDVVATMYGCVCQKVKHTVVFFSLMQMK